jgi:outer membrane biosynthesis protein TonB
VQFVIDEKGNVEVVRVLTAEVPVEVAARLAATIRAWRFPASPAGTPTTVVVVF